MNMNENLRTALSAVTGGPAPAVEVEGDVSTWHIRLHTRVGEFEVWCLYNGDCQESSPTLKDSVRKWRDEELARAASQ